MRRFCESLKESGYDQVELYFAIKNRELIEKIKSENQSDGKPSHLRLVHSSNSVESSNQDQSLDQSKAA